MHVFVGSRNLPVRRSIVETQTYLQLERRSLYLIAPRVGPIPKILCSNVDRNIGE